MADFLSGIEDSLDGVALPGVGLGTRRRDGWLSALMNAGDPLFDGMSGRVSGSERGQPRLAQLMNQTESEPPYAARMNDGGTAAAPVDNRIEDDRSRHPQGQDSFEFPALSRRPPLREAMNAVIPPPPDTSGLTLRDAMSRPSASPSPTVLPPTPLIEAQAGLARAEKPSGISGLMTKARGIHNPILRGIAEVGAGGARALDIAGSMVAPNWAAMIPGSTLNRAMRLRGAQSRLGQAEADDLKEAQAENLRSEAAQRRAKPDLEQTAAGRRQLAQEYGLQGDDAVRYILTGQMPVAADKPNLSEQIGQRSQLADQYGLQGSERQRYILTGQLPADKPDTAVQEDSRMEGLKARQLRGEKLTPQDEADLRAYSWRKTLGPQATASAADIRQARQQTFENTKEARKAIADAEKQYRNAKEAGDALNGFIELARGGNKEAGATVPLEGTLRIVTSQGVKRINRTEVEGIEGAGSLFDRIQSKIGKWTQGQPIPPDLLNDFDELNKTLTNAGYQNYSDAYDQARDLYEPAGVDFRKIKKLSPPGQQLKDRMNQGAGGAPAGMVRFQDSQGGIHDIPRKNLEKARIRDPGLRILGQ